MHKPQGVKSNAKKNTYHTFEKSSSHATKMYMVNCHLPSCEDGRAQMNGDPLKSAKTNGTCNTSAKTPKKYHICLDIIAPEMPRGSPEKKACM